MEIDFSELGATLKLEPHEFGFLFRCLSDRLATLEDWEVLPRLGLEPEDARALVEQLLAREKEARVGGRHWIPPHPEWLDEK